MSAPPGRRYAARRSPDERRTELLDAALAVVVERGYAGATLGAIAERAGVTKPVIYSVFANRDAFFGALLDREERHALQAVGAAMPGPELLRTGSLPEVAAAVAAGVAGLLDAVAADPLPWRLILTEADATPPSVRARMASDREVVHAGLLHVVTLGLGRAGRIDLDAGLLTHALFAAVERFARLVAADPAAVDPERAGAVVAALLPAPV